MADEVEGGVVSCKRELSASGFCEALWVEGYGPKVSGLPRPLNAAPGFGYLSF